MGLSLFFDNELNLERNLSDFKRRKISFEKNLGEILKSARKKKEITLDQAEEETKVRVKYLKALEEGRYEALPGNVYALGFLSKYVDFLELNKEDLMRRFRLERGESQYDDFHSKLMPERRIKEPLLYLTPKVVVVVSVILVLAGLLGYIIYSVRAFTTPPNLLVSSPSSEQVLTRSTVDIIGKTDEGVTLLINDQTVLLDDRGNFTQQVKLNPGLNTFEVKAISRLKKEKVVQVKILAQF
ncbi:TPA: transcriptional regulator [Candidatus Berkelbacteria bacterium]|uniref:XRE family transcriptional regulator n=1 Tax=Berkelbacteria bacterium GW2011_GWE1_39_12 TaxID=1618337 RepID=A0A0G4B3D4_9BACT|nr:MAG: XRE family transcriptional regulator [Berkelbacteria bacterium GW2011_GWE1_39_12]HBO60940.1 transcriptional regulator [Candidatus Berkelbacteria bacterium]